MNFEALHAIVPSSGLFDDLGFQQLDPSVLDQTKEDAATLRLLILSAQDPYPQRITHRWSVSMPCNERRFKSLFPAATKTISKDPGDRIARRVSWQSQMSATFASPILLEDRFGEDWYTTHHKDCVGVVCGKLTFRLKKKIFIQYQSDEEQSFIPGTLNSESASFLQVSFNFRRVPRVKPIPGDERDWEVTVADLVKS